MAKTPRRITSAYLMRVTTHYLERYATSREHLRRLLLRRVHRSAAYHEHDPEPWIDLLDAELDRLVRVGALDDTQYAKDRAATMLRRGAGRRKIESALRGKGLSSEAIEVAMEAVAESSEGDPDRAAARTYARKRRVGPWRRGELDDERRRKEMAKLGRAGFSFEVARWVVDATTPEELAD